MIEEAESIRLTACGDYDCQSYLVYKPSYPWDLLEHERLLGEKNIVDALCKYISIITDDEISIDYYSVENGG